VLGIYKKKKLTNEKEKLDKYKVSYLILEGKLKLLRMK